LITGESESKGRTTSTIDASVLDDILNIEAVVVILRAHTLSIYDQWVGLQKVDAQIFSGLVSAIAAMITELSSRTEVRERHSFLEFSQSAGDEDLIVWAAQGKFVSIALILKRRSSKDLRRILASLVYEYESKLHDEIVNFIGSLDGIYEKSEEIVEQTLHFEFLRPMRLIMDPSECPKGSQALARVIKEEQRALASSEGLFLRELVSVAIRSLGDIPYHRVLQQVISLVKKGSLVSVDEAGKLSKIELAIEAIDKVLLRDEQATLSEVTEDGAETKPVIDTIESSTSIPQESEKTDEIMTASKIEKSVEGDIPYEKSLALVLEVLNKQKLPDVPLELVKDIMEREITYSGGKGKILSPKTSEIKQAQVQSNIKGTITSEISCNALDGPLFDTKDERYSISKTKTDYALLVKALLSK